MSSNICLSPHDTIIRDILSRFYKCPIVNSLECSRKISLTENESHCNILPANLVFETNKYFYLLQVFSVIFICVVMILIIFNAFLGDKKCTFFSRLYKL